MRPLPPEGLVVAAVYVVPGRLTARSLFAELPHGRAYADRLIDALATGAMVAVVESVCAQALQDRLDDDETLVGTRVEIAHCAPAPVGQALHIEGRGHGGPAGAPVRFDLRVRDAGGLVARLEVGLLPVSRRRIDARIARRRSSPAEV